MRVPLSWLREYVDLPAGETGRDVGGRLISAGLEVETVEQLGADLTGPLVVGRVLEIDEFTASNGKTIRYCQVEVGEGEPRGIICGARNFSVGDAVVVALPGAVLPGGFAITARKTYGRVSDGMICSGRELGISDDHTGIIVLPAGEPGADAGDLLGLRDDVLDIAVTPDRGYCLSVRGVAREAATAYGVAFRDPADVKLPEPGPEQGHQAHVADPTACDRFVLRTVTGLDPAAATPLWMQRRLQMAGMRPLSLAVDVTNYVMLELGQPLHAFDRKKLDGDIVVRRAEPGERLETLDHVVRELDPEDILITDSSGPISLAGTMGGLHSEIDEASVDLVLEAAHFDAVGTARMSRRHRLSSEASRRFERGVDPELPPRAAARAAALLAEYGGALLEGSCEVDLPREHPIVTIPADHPSRVAGLQYPVERVIERLEQVGCAVSDDGTLTVRPPTWRPDLTDPNDLAEEVIRLEGYENVPSRLPKAPPGRGYTAAQRLRRRVGQALAAAGYAEVHCYPFVGDHVWDDLGLAADDDRRGTVRLLNPLSETEPALRTTLLPGLLGALRRNVGRGQHDLALYEIGMVYYPAGDATVAPRPSVSGPPSAEEAAALDAAIPRQPRYAAAVLAGDREPAGWWGKGRPASWADAVEAARTVARAAGVELRVYRSQIAPWHPGRCAALAVGERVVGFAGELHPRVVAALEVPARTCAMELDLDAVAEAAGGLVPAPKVSTYPVATQDVALVVDASVPAAAVEEALRDGAGELLESVRLFDVYVGDQIGEGRRSLAYALRFRAPDRTLTVDEATAARDAAVAEAARRTGAVLRGV